LNLSSNESLVSIQAFAFERISYRYTEEEDFSNDESDSEGGARRPKTKKKKKNANGGKDGEDGALDDDQNVRARLQELGGALHVESS
jgi:hypothetical protein